MKRKWLHELPYMLIALYATKIGQAWRLAEGTDAAYKLLSLMDSLSASFASPLPSFELHDLCFRISWRMPICTHTKRRPFLLLIWEMVNGNGSLLVFSKKLQDGEYHRLWRLRYAISCG